MDSEGPTDTPRLDMREFFWRVYKSFATHQKAYEETGILQDITLQKMSLEMSDLSAGIAHLIDDDTPLQHTFHFRSLRLHNSPASPPTLQDHLETYFYILLYATYDRADEDCTGKESVTRILRYIRTHYVELSGPREFITRGTDVAMLIEDEACTGLNVYGMEPLADFLDGALVGIWGWYAHHQIVHPEDLLTMHVDEAYASSAARALYLYEHKGMKEAFEDALDGWRRLDRGLVYKERRKRRRVSVGAQAPKL